MTREEFLAGMDNWSSHRLLLWLALEETKYPGDPILEMGVGAGSSPFLMKYCADTGGRLRYALDYSEEWAEKYGAVHVENWDFFRLPLSRQWSVSLVDESPGNHRKESILLLKNSEIIVVHDSEPAGSNASDYQVRPLFKDFKYIVDVKSVEPGGAWATALSNTIDITKWIGEKHGEYEVIEFQG